MLVIRDESGNILSSSCPYDGYCNEVSGNTDACIRLKNEIQAYNRRNMREKAFPALGIDSTDWWLLEFKGWETQEDLDTLVYDVGRKVYVDEELRVAVFQAKPHSRSLGFVLLDMISAGIFYSCSVPGCSNPGVCKRSSNYYCMDDKPRRTDYQNIETFKYQAYVEILRLLGNEKPNEIFH